MPRAISQLDRFRAELQRRPIAIFTAVFLVGLAAQAMLKRQSEWQDVFVLAARDLLAGNDIYAPGRAYLYPPFLALIAVPFTVLPPLLSRLVWYAINALCAVVLVRAAWQLAGGASFAAAEWARREWAAAVLGMLCAGTYMLNTFAHQQTDLLIAALMLAGAVGLVRGHDPGAGALLGLAAACKATPLLWVPYLLLRQRWTATGTLVLVAVGVNLLPNLVRAPPGGGTWLGLWLARYVLPLLQAPVGFWGSDLVYNQSIAGFVQRLSNTAWEWSSGQIVIVTRTGAFDPIVLKAVAYAILLALILISLAAALRPAPATAADDTPAKAAFEFSLVLILMLLLSPMSSKSHFDTLLLPAYCLARYGILRGDRLVLACLAAATAIGLLTNKNLIGGDFYTLLLWYGSVTIATLLLWIGCILVLARGSPARH